MRHGKEKAPDQFLIKGFAYLVAWDGIEPSTRGFSNRMPLALSLRVSALVGS